MSWGNTDQDFEDYGKYPTTFGGSAATDFQGAWNLFSNPIGFFGDLGSGNNPAGHQSGALTSFSNPLGIDFTGGNGGWNQNLAKNKDVFQSMSQDDWDAFGKMDTKHQDAWIAQRAKDVASQKDAKTAADAQKAKEAAYQQWRDATLKKLSDFGDKMNMSVDDLVKTGDAGMIANRNQAANAAGARGVGLSGGISEANTQRATADAAMKYQMGRQQMGQQAYGQLLSGLQTQYMNDEDRRRYEQGMNLNLQQAQAAAQQQKYMQGMQQQSGLFGLAGGIIGGIYGGAGGAQAGSAIGQGVGSYTYGQNNPYQPYQYHYPSGYSGGTGYGGGNQSGLSGAGGGYPKYGNSQ